MILLAGNRVAVAGTDFDFPVVEDERERSLDEVARLLVWMAVRRDSGSGFDFEMLDIHRFAAGKQGEMNTVDGFGRVALLGRNGFHAPLTRRNYLKVQQGAAVSRTMYAVVGCGECSSLWVVEGSPETTTCPSCGKRHRFDALKKFAETADADAAREARTTLLTGRSDHAPDELDSFAELESTGEAGGMSDEEYLRQSGLDAERVTAAGERTTETHGSQSRMEIVREALSTLDRPTESEVIAYAQERDVPTAFTERALEKLVRQGAVSEHRSRYRLL